MFRSMRCEFIVNKVLFGGCFCRPYMWKTPCRKALARTFRKASFDTLSLSSTPRPNALQGGRLLLLGPFEPHPQEECKRGGTVYLSAPRSQRYSCECECEF